MIKEALNSYAVTNNQWAGTDRSQTVGASEVGACARKVFWIKNEGDPVHGAARDPDYVDGWGATTRGTVFENQFWYPAMKARFGDNLFYAGPNQLTFVTGFLSATPDGLVIGQPADALASLGIDHIGGGLCFMAECKTADPRTNLSEPKPENVFQVHVQLGIVREKTQFKPEYSLLSYTNASFWDDVTEFPIKFDPEIYEVAKNRATLIMTAQHASELKPEGWIAGGKECEHCPFTRACGITRRSAPRDDKPADPQFVAEMAELATKAKYIEGLVGANAADLREVQQEIRDRLREKGVRKIPGIISWSNIKGRKTYDNKRIYEAAIEAGIDIEQYAKVGDETDRLTISEPKEMA
jgi:hypothetical protein